MRQSKRQTQRGAALIEFALSATLLVMLAVGAVSFGLAIQSSIVVADAAYAGASYGANSVSNATNTAGMQQAALAAGAGVKNITATASYWCTCSGGALVSCPTDCGSNADLKFFVQVTASATYNNFFKYAGMPATFTLQSTSVLPVE
jgi:Flp pilus assembly protein TadG